MVRKAGLVPITSTHRKILIPKHIRVVAQLATEKWLQRSLDVKSSKPAPLMRALIPNKGLYELNPDLRSLLDVHAKLRSELVASALGRCGNCPLADRKQVEGQPLMIGHFPGTLTKL
jgi:hypothetical protein